MSLVESSVCKAPCIDCLATVSVRREDLERVMKLALCDEIRGIIGKYLNGIEAKKRI